MFNIPTINSFKIFNQYFQLACVVLSVGLGMLVIIAYLSKFFKYDYISSNSLFFAMFIGFFHHGFASMIWLKSTYHIHGISDFGFDVYTFPVACFSFTFAVICTKELRKISFAFAVYIFKFVLLVFGTWVVRSFNKHYSHGNVTLKGTSNAFNNSVLKSKCGIFENMFTISVLQCYNSFWYCIYEYVFMLAPFTMILLWNRKESVFSRGQQGKLMYFVKI